MPTRKLIVSTIVEGHGEVAALPILIRRITAWLCPELYVEIPSPIRVSRDRFLRRPEEQKRVIQLACLKGATEETGILILLDSDDDCPAELGPLTLEILNSIRPDFRFSMVLAKREYEAWFLAAAESLRGKRNFPSDLEIPPDPEAIRGAKEWIKYHRTDKKYKETIDQPALSQLMDLEQARTRSPSFDKLCRDLENWFKIPS